MWRMIQANRAALRGRVRDDWHPSEELADAIVAEWEVQATTRGLDGLDPTYWTAAVQWIEERFHCHNPIH